MPNLNNNNQQYITEFHPDIVKVSPALPAAASFNDYRYWHSGRNMEFISDGTRWLSSSLFHADWTMEPSRPVSTGSVVATNYGALRASIGELQLVSGNGGLQVEGLILHFYSTVAQTAANYTDWAWIYFNTSGSSSAGLTISGTANTQGQGANGWKSYNIITPGSPVLLLDGSLSHLQFNLNLRGTLPVNQAVYAHGTVNYRVIG